MAKFDTLTEKERELAQALKAADPETQIRMAMNLFRAGHFEVVGSAGVPFLLEKCNAIMKKIKQNDTNLDADLSESVHINLGTMPDFK